MSGSKQDPNEFSLLSALETMVKYRRFIVINVSVVVILAVIVSLVMPKWYRSTAVILPPETPIDPLAAMGALQMVAATSSLPWFSTTSDVYGAILESRLISKEIIERFDLMRRYRTESLDDALKVFSKHRSIRVLDEGMIEVSIEARDPVIAADMANAVLELLDDFNKNTRMTEGKRTERFIEKRLEETGKDLQAGEEKLQRFQEEYGAVELTAQTEALIEAAAEIESQISAIDVQLAKLRNFATEDFPQVRTFRAQKRNLEEQLKQLVGDTELASSLSADGGAALSPALRRLPDVGIRYVRLRRDVELLSKVRAFLRQEFERARIQATRDTPTIQMLDKASPPEKRHRPRRTLIVLVAFSAALFGSIALTFGLDSISRWKEDDENHRRLTRMIRTLRADWSRSG